MSQEIEKFEGKKAIMMRSRLVHWISETTGEGLQNQLQTQQGHTFVKIRELGITINTAEVEGVYTVLQYEDLAKVKQGMWQCEYQKWHGKREECGCKAERWKQHEEIMRKARVAHDNRELTPEERANNIKKVKEIGDHFRSNGMFGLGSEQMLKGTRKCVMCPNLCPGNSQWYCSGGCLNKAKEQGIYGREEQHLEALAM